MIFLIFFEFLNFCFSFWFVDVFEEEKNWPLRFEGSKRKRSCFQIFELENCEIVNFEVEKILGWWLKSAWKMGRNECTMTPGGLNRGERLDPVNSDLPGISGVPPRLSQTLCGLRLPVALKLTLPLQKHQKSLSFIKNWLFQMISGQLYFFHESRRIKLNFWSP